MVGLAVLFRNLNWAMRRVMANAETQGLVLVVCFLVGVGTVFYHQVEDMDWVDSLYFTIVTLTTIGYGDFVPTTDMGKLFTVGYSLIGIGVLVVFMTNLGTELVAVRRERRRRDAERLGTGGPVDPGEAGPKTEGGS